jgi:hypothetical protein
MTFGNWAGSDMMVMSSNLPGSMALTGLSMPPVPPPPPPPPIPAISFSRSRIELRWPLMISLSALPTRTLNFSRLVPT